MTILVILNYHQKPLCHHFREKGIGEVLIHSMQVLSNKLSDDFDNEVLLKCTDELKSFYQSVGFEKIKKRPKG